MALTIQQFYRIAVQQLPDLELMPLLHHAVSLYEVELESRFAFVLNVQTDELICAKNTPNENIVSEIKRLAKPNANQKIQPFITSQTAGLYFSTIQLNEAYILSVGFSEQLTNDAMSMLHDVGSALALRVKQVAEQTRNVLFKQLIDNSSDAIQ
ncbi:MAG: hypothetical protein ACK5B6_13740, partial [Bacteroidia bacterium]